ncbi:DNA-directed primase/polymerase protein isoform X2 [Alligator sinensis]|uniref:DNA-directed primase/polymerase protein n=1 Tax=Alligator sinensis TaxID=38654 RepID=A0A3Q0GYZ1_ALLSI|nr:DNA-directed primase/polymerase protein isoform X2 [Alligator sinensis]
MKRKWEEKLKKIEELESQYKRNPLCSAYRPKLSKPWQPSSVWKIFPRQAQAFDYVKTCKEEVHVFALEKNTEDGQRFYLVTTYIELWFYYKGQKSSLFHCYEVICEKAVCKLYFDLEFYKPVNPGADGKMMVAQLIELFCKNLEERYGVKCSANDVLNLDSSTDEKFSHHLIFLLHKTAFKDNIHVGNFVRRVLQPALRLTKTKAAAVIPEEEIGHVFQSSKATAELNGSPVNAVAVTNASGSWQSCMRKTLDTETSQQKEKSEFSFLVVNDKDGGSQLFVDMGVYTKNRNFRLYKSSKSGRRVILEIAEDNKFVPKLKENISIEEQYFLSSLVCNIRSSDIEKILTCDNPDGKRVLTDPIEGYHYSPYPEVDRFVLSLVNKDGVQGGIRHWNYFSLEELLVYDISRYRWCENIGRAHKSNNIMILIDLKREVWYQKCHDPVCRAENFKSKRSPLPPEICLPFLFKEEEEYVFMDESGNKKEKVELSSNPPDFSESIPLRIFQDNRKSFGKLCSNTEWDNASDDACFLEATEDIELAEAADNGLTTCNYNLEEIPDELLLEAEKTENMLTSSNKLGLSTKTSQLTTTMF